MSKLIQLRNVPDALHRQLKARAALAGMPLSDYLIREARKLAEYPTPEEMRERLKAARRTEAKSRHRSWYVPSATAVDRHRCS